MTFQELADGSEEHRKGSSPDVERLILKSGMSASSQTLDSKCMGPTCGHKGLYVYLTMTHMISKASNYFYATLKFFKLLSLIWYGTMYDI